VHAALNSGPSASERRTTTELARLAVFGLSSPMERVQLLRPEPLFTGSLPQLAE